MVSGFNRRGFLSTSGTLLGAVAAARWKPAFSASRARMRDVVVVLPGITGSALTKDGRDIWSISPKAVLGALASMGHSLDTLKLTDDSPEIDDIGDGVTADRLIPDLHLIPGLWKIDGYTKLISRLLGDFDMTYGQNFFEFPYDWRRDNRVGARRLARASHGWLKAWREKSGNRNAKLILIAHSMGGLVCRYFLEVLEGWRDTRRLISIGTPHRGSLKALGFVSDGICTYLEQVNAVDLTSLLRSFTSVYQLLPIYPCFDSGDGSLRRVSEVTGIPNLDAARARMALQFHREIENAVNANSKNEEYLSHGYAIHPIVGTYQSTPQTARLVDGMVKLVTSYPGIPMDGDGTVPRVSATPIELSDQDRELFVAEAHASLQNSDWVHAQMQGLLTSGAIDWEKFRKRAAPAIALSVNDAYRSDEPVVVSAQIDQENASLRATVRSVGTGMYVFRGNMKLIEDQRQQVELRNLQAGAYRVSVIAGENGPSVTDVFVVGGQP